MPIVLYGQFEAADTQRRELVSRGIQQRSWLIAQALAPILNRPEGPPHKSLNAELQRFNDERTLLKLMFRPGNSPSSGNFYYIASAPESRLDQIGAELEGLADRGILRQLSESCAWDRPIDIRYRQPDGHEEIMTSVLPIQSRWGCWVLISAHPTTEFLNISIGRSYWQTREIRIAAAIYFAFALLAILIALSVWRSLHHFRKVAREIRQGRMTEYSFTDRNIVPELTSVATDFDHLVRDLRNIAQDIRQTAEDNAHSFKGPLSTIQASLEPIRRILPEDNPRANRAVGLIEASLSRLNMLVNSTQRLDFNTADMIDAPRLQIDLTRLVADVLLRYREIMTERNIRLIRMLEEDATIRAAHGVVDIVFENILDNAISFSSPGGTIAVYLFREADRIHLHVDDEGPGIDPRKIEHIFDRYFSQRPKGSRQIVAGAQQSANHAGLGLWIVRRNIEAIGGSISAVNRIGGGLSIRIVLPYAR
ncbi:MAG: HAMP domain-containing histidine kinase [Ferrovibrio sp.]|uniref:sensor histidine kinase n=1 Tax=Ferrovibrio sp. TaxID=1917215 RepID=UPI002634688C|nr:HAMP domain-containing sensor histidine kinase [Ferrovibrio sp.]MCW0235863.1 HAMP domain-containing histidine kinase [Ferrovibrio sp.]